ncbi:MAG: glycosyltransferase [Oscillospiraceae bacterium]|nr:glycosyltransferase [Oscillospiraceae bacterium]MBQ8869731.1 glycosyltransferase [Oscillospiraceae bacterium]
MSAPVFEPYSVLMSVYHREKAEFLRKSVESIFAQSILPDEFVLVIDGPVGKELFCEIESLKKRFEIKCVELAENVGLGRALNFGLSHCKNEIVARMDSDDIAKLDRMEKQLDLMQKNDADIVSAAVLEFKETPDDAQKVRSVPQSHDEIMGFLKKRNPFNHPAVVYKKSVIENAGGYMDYEFFEDYELFARILSKGAKSANVAEPLVFMRTGSGMYSRRGGVDYVKSINRFYRKMRALGFCSLRETVFCQLPRVIIALLPTAVRKFVYQKFLRG